MDFPSLEVVHKIMDFSDTVNHKVKQTTFQTIFKDN